MQAQVGNITGCAVLLVKVYGEGFKAICRGAHTSIGWFANPHCGSHLDVSANELLVCHHDNVTKPRDAW